MRIQWESVTGLPNRGLVVFHEVRMVDGQE
jgi:uncharacterized membrane protein